MQKHETLRDEVEETILSRYKNITPFSPTDHKKIDKYKDGTFGMSTLGFALYSNGHNVRGLSTQNRFGLMYEDGESIFSIGYFRKELAPDDELGYIFICSPRGKNVIEKASKFTEDILADANIKCKGVYIRFLKSDQYVAALNKGFSPIKVSPWHPEAPEEDETFVNAIVNIRNLINLGPDMEVSSVNRVENLQVVRSKYKKNIKYTYRRFTNFLGRNKFTYKLERFPKDAIPVAKQTIESHFNLLKSLNKNIGSTAEDYFNLLNPNVLELQDVFSYIGYIENVPISVFIGEKVSEDMMALYSTFTLRDFESLLTKLDLQITSDQITGFTAISNYAIIRLFGELLNEGIEKVHLGGSEFADLNKFKRYLGGQADPTYWVVKPKN